MVATMHCGVLAHPLWLHIQRARAGMCVRYCCVQNTTKKVLHLMIKSLPLVQKDKISCFTEDERSTIQLPLDCAFALQRYRQLIKIWKPSVSDYP